MSFQDARESFLYDVWSDVEVLELGIALALADDEGGLADQVGLLPLLRLAHPVLLLDVLDLLERRVQIRTGRVDLTGLFDVCTSVGDFFDEGGALADSREVHSVLADVGRSGMEEVDTQVSVVSFDGG